MKERSTMMSQQQQLMMNMNQSMVMNQMCSQPQPQMIPPNRSYGLWAPPPQFQNPNPNPGAVKPPLPAFKKSLGPRSDWKGKKVNKLNVKRRSELQKSLMPGSSSIGISGGVNMAHGNGGVGNSNFNSYQPPTLNELQHQNPLKARKFYHKKKFNKSNNMNMNMEVNNDYYSNSMSAPFAPRNTTSFIIRAKKSGGIASLVSPSPMTPAVLPTPILSPSREVLVDMAKEEWGVDGYGSMKGLIRLRSPGHEMEIHDDEMEDEGGSSESDVEGHVEVERRLDHDLSRFEMIYHPNEVGGMEYHNVLENRVDDQDSHIAQLEEENLILKERLFLMERDLGELRRRVQFLENRGHKGEEHNEEVVDNDFENESEHHGNETHSVEGNNGDLSEDNITQDVGSCKRKQVDGGHISENYEAAVTANRSLGLGFEEKMEKNDNGIGGNEIDKMAHITEVEGKDASKTDKLIVVDNAEESKLVKDIEEINNNENKYTDALVDVFINVDVEASKHVVAEGDVCTEEIGVQKPNKVLPSDVGN